VDLDKRINKNKCKIWGKKTRTLHPLKNINELESRLLKYQDKLFAVFIITEFGAQNIFYVEVQSKRYTYIACVSSPQCVAIYWWWLRNNYV